MSEAAVQSRDLQIGAIPGFAALPLARSLFIPLSCGDGPTETEEIRKGKVRRGEALSGGNLASGFTPVAPAAGEVIGTREIQLTSGKRARAVEIKVGPDQSEFAPEAVSPAEGNLSEALERVSSLGVWADRTTAPDLIGQLQAGLKRPIETVICNLLEADGAPLNAAIVRAGAAPVVAGALALATVLAARVQFVVDAEQYGSVNTALRNAKANYARVIELANDYPQADPTILLYMLTGRRLCPGRLPVEKGVLMLDAAAALAVGQAIAEGRPMLEIPLVIRERGHGRVHLVSAAIGTPMRHVLEALGIDSSNVIIRAGAVLRDVRISPESVIAGADTRFDVGPVVMAPIADPCIRCGWCVAACPTRIHPAGLLEAAQQNDEDLAESYGIHACIECGICSYVCPSRLPLLNVIRDLKRHC